MDFKAQMKVRDKIVDLTISWTHAGLNLWTKGLVGKKALVCHQTKTTRIILYLNKQKAQCKIVESE